MKHVSFDEAPRQSDLEAWDLEGPTPAPAAWLLEPLKFRKMRGQPSPRRTRPKYQFSDSILISVDD